MLTTIVLSTILAFIKNSSSDMRSQMARSMDRETDLAKSYSVMSFVNREPVHPKSKEMATIRGGRITDTVQILVLTG